MKYARRIFIALAWFANLFLALHHAFNRNWQTANFFLLFVVLMELADMNGRLTWIQKALAEWEGGK